MRVNRQIAGLFLCALMAMTTACGSSPTSASATPGYSQTDVRLGTGAEVVSGSVLTVQYTGWLYDPKKTDQKANFLYGCQEENRPFSNRRY